MYRSSPFRSSFSTSYIRFGHVWSMYRSSPFRSTLNTSYIRFGHVWSMYRSSPLRSTLNTSYIRFGHVWSMYRSSPLRSTLNTSYIRFGHVWSMYWSSPLRSTLNTSYIRFGHVWSMYRSSPLRSTLTYAHGFLWHVTPKTSLWPQKGHFIIFQPWEFSQVKTPNGFVSGTPSNSNSNLKLNKNVLRNETWGVAPFLAPCYERDFRYHQLRSSLHSKHQKYLPSEGWSTKKSPNAEIGSLEYLPGTPNNHL